MWDVGNRLRQVQEADGGVQRYDWDAEGRILRHTDPLGQQVHYQYDGLGRLTEKTDANGHRLRYTYDAVGRLTLLTNENGEHTRFGYDLNDNLQEERGFDGRLQRYQYNAAGELTHLIEAGGSEYGPGKVTRFERDALGRLLQKVCDAEPQQITRYRYDRLGQLIAADNPQAKLSFAYTPLGELREEVQTLHGAQALKLQHRYDELGNRIQTTLPDGRIINRLHYGSGHLHQLNLMQADGSVQLIADIERDALHREIRRSQGVLQSQFAYDPMGRLLQQRTRQQLGNREWATTIARDYRYDLGGNLLQKQAQVTATAGFGGRRESLHYQYDPAGRILQALRTALGTDAPGTGAGVGAHTGTGLGTGAQEIERFSYDPAGNLDEFRLGLPGNRLSTWQDVRYRYDAHGNLLSRQRGAHESALFAWDTNHQLRRATVTRHGVTQDTHYEYDALGRRTRKRDAFGATEYLWDGDLLLHSQRGAKQSLYFYEADSFVPLATLQDGALYWYHCDQIGTPQELSDAQGRIVWAAQYKVWGEATMLQVGNGAGMASGEALPQIDQPFRFQGQQFDAETGLHYNRFRYYDPVCGRFVSQDPIGLLGGVNLFAYANNPLAWVDPFGLARVKGITPNNKGTRTTIEGGERNVRTCCWI